MKLVKFYSGKGSRIIVLEGENLPSTLESATNILKQRLSSKYPAEKFEVKISSPNPNTKVIEVIEKATGKVIEKTTLTGDKGIPKPLESEDKTDAAKKLAEKKQCKECGTGTNDCLLGRCQVDVIYPDGSIERMSMSKFFQKFLNNPNLRIRDLNGNAILIESIIMTHAIGKTQIVRFKVNEQILRLTADHQIQLADGRFISAKDLRNGMRVRTPQGSAEVSELISYQAKCVKTYELKTCESYVLTEDGPILRNLQTISASSPRGHISVPEATTPNLAQEILDSGGVITSFKKMQSIARTCGYDLIEGKKHTNVYDSSGRKITEIPRHELNPNTARGILKDLATGVPSF